MVQGIGFPGRDIYGERPVDASMAESRMVQTQTPSVPVQNCLNDHCGMRVKDFALLALRQDGKVETLLSPGFKPMKHQIFPSNLMKDIEYGVRISRDGIFSPTHQFDNFLAYQEGDNDRDALRRQSSSTDSSSGRIALRARHLNFGQAESFSARSQARKRQRGSDDIPIQGQKKRSLRIGDQKAVNLFYEQRFKDMQQAACKVIAKAFVKLVEPKKQTHHPYTKGEEYAPSWWPKGSVKHKEPDHLLKDERIFLLIHILRHVMNHSRSEESKSVDIGKLQEVTMEAMSRWFTDPEHPGNAQKKPYLKEIFTVATQEERLLNGEIDSDTTVPVMHGDSRSGIELSDDENEESVKYEDDHDTTHNIGPMSQEITTPESLVSPASMHNRSMDGATGAAYGFPTRDLPVRGYQSQALPPPLEEQNSYNDASTIQMGSHGVYGMRQRNAYDPQPSPLLHDSSRRPTWQQPSPGYPSPISTTSNSVFSNTWQQHGNGMMQGNQAPYTGFSSTPLVATAPPGAYLPPPTAPMNPLPPISQHQQHFENMGTRSYEPVTSIVRTGSIGHATHGYPDYLQGGCYNGPEGEVKND